MQQIPAENPLYASPSVASPSFGTDVPIQEWRSTRLTLMLMFNNEFNEDYEEAKAFLKGKRDFNVEKDIGFINEYPLAIDYIEPNVNDTPPYWLYLISCGGPGSEIRFFVDHKSSTEPYKVEFWFLEWSNSRKQDVTGEAIIEQLWEQALLPLTEQIETQNEEPSQETDPLLALAGTLKWDDIRRPNAALPPEIRVVKGPYEDHPDPLIALLGTLECDVTDIGERHDEYIADALLAELRGDEDE